MTETSNAKWPDLAGRIEGCRHSLPVRVYFEDTDFSGFVYHASYLRWYERGRSDFIRLLGISHADLIAPEAFASEVVSGSREGDAPRNAGGPAAFVVRRLEIDYLRPARIDEVLEIITECAEVGRVHLQLAQEIRRGGEVLCRAAVKVVLVTLAGRPLRLPKPLLDRFISG
jgi:acyl-CoA thioester hydrolase